MDIQLRLRFGPRSGGPHVSNADPVEAYRDAAKVTLTGTSPDNPGELEWSHRDPLRLLDVDYHGTTPGIDQGDLVAKLACRAWSPSSGGLGLHALYTDTAGYTADQLAAVDAVRVALLDPCVSGCEVKTNGRQPSSPDAITVNNGTDELFLGGLGSLISHCGVSDAAIDAWLAEHRMEKGRRYDHDRCPINPLHHSRQKGPVLVTEHGVYCHSCAGRDEWYLGARKAGWAPFALLVSGDKPLLGATIDCAEHLTHWAHARFAVYGELSEALRLPPIRTDWEPGTEPGTWSMARAVYGAMCAYCSKLGPEDPRLGSVWTAGKWIVRTVGGVWSDARGAKRYEEIGDKPGVATLGALPACQYVDDEGKVKVDKSSVDRAAHRGVLPGYPCLARRYGMRAWGQYLRYAEPETELTAHLLDPGRTPVYRPVGSRMPDDEAWHLLDERFPGVNRQYLELCMAARIIAEGGANDAPIIVAIGPSGAAKSTTPKLAARLLGDRYYETQVGLPPNEILNAIGEFGTRVGLIVVNELNKSAAAARLKPAQCWTPILGIQANLGYRKMYVGSVSVPMSAAIVLTDVQIPSEIVKDPQYARRVFFAQLSDSTKRDWRTLGGPLDLWPGNTDHPREAELAADAIVSSVIDRWFGPGCSPTMWDVTSELGFGTLANYAKVNEIDDSLLDMARLFDAITHPATADQRSTKRVNGRWRVADRDGADELSQAWAEVSDGRGKTNLSASEIAAAVDLAGLFDGGGVRFEATEESALRTRMRFKRGTGRGPASVINEDLIDQFKLPDGYTPIPGGLVERKLGNGD